MKWHEKKRRIGGNQYDADHTNSGAEECNYIIQRFAKIARGERGKCLTSGE